MYNYHLFTTLCIKTPYWSEAKMSIVHHQEVPTIYRRRNRIPALCLDIHTHTHPYTFILYNVLYITIPRCHRWNWHICLLLQILAKTIFFIAIEPSSGMVQHSDFDPVRFLPKWTQSYEVPSPMFAWTPCLRMSARRLKHVSKASRCRLLRRFLRSSWTPHQAASKKLAPADLGSRNTGKTGWKRGVNMTPN